MEGVTEDSRPTVGRGKVNPLFFSSPTKREGKGKFPGLAARQI